ncbi:MAG: glycosyltransferase [Chloroflexi bacterium]|nr:glycosyltransferase [Chloroflexota bacterium]
MEVVRRARQLLDTVALPLSVALLGASGWRAWQQYRATPPAETLPTPVTVDSVAREGAPLVSVLVAAWNERDTIGALIDSFESLTYPAAELILCAGGRDGTYELASQRASDRIRVVYQEPGLGKQRALQRCYAEAHGSIIMLTDADCRLVDEAFLRLLAPILQGEAEVATGLSEPGEEERRAGLVHYQWLIDRWWHHQLPREGDGLHGRNCALTRAVLDRVGAFETHVPTGTDYHLSQSLRQAGYRIRVVHDSRVVSEYPAEAAGYLRMYERWHKNLLILGPRFGAWMDVRRVLTAFGLYGTMVALPFAAPLVGRIAPAASGVLLATALLQRLARASAGARLAGEPISSSLVLQAAQATVLDITAVFLAMYATLDPRRRGRW